MGLGPGAGWGDGELRPGVLVAEDATSMAHRGEGRTAAVLRTPTSVCGRHGGRGHAEKGSRESSLCRETLSGNDGVRDAA
jgi:hypothetical protein